MAANGMFGAGKDGLINAPDPSREYTLSMAEVAVFDAAYYQLLIDLTVITDLAKVRDEIFYPSLVRLKTVVIIVEGKY